MKRIALTLGILMLSVAGCDDKRPASSAEAPNAPVADVETADWCAEHGVPESVCTRCNKKLIPEFKRKGDWCKEHNLPESQCIECNPELKEKFEAMRPKSGG